MTPGAIVLAALVAASSAQAPQVKPPASILLKLDESVSPELPDRLKLDESVASELPDRFTGQWKLRPDIQRPYLPGYIGSWWLGSGNRPFCVAKNPEGRVAIFVRSPRVSIGPNEWVFEKSWNLVQAGAAFMTDGAVFAWVLDQQINLAVGHVFRFEESEGVLSVSELDPASLLDALESEGRPVARSTQQLEVEWRHLIRLLRQNDLRFRRLATADGIDDRHREFPPCGYPSAR